MLCSSLAQAPKSINLQRSQQKGRYSFSADHTADFLQVGQGTMVVGLVCVITCRAELLPAPNNVDAMITPLPSIDWYLSRSQ